MPTVGPIDVAAGQAAPSTAAPAGFASALSRQLGDAPLAPWTSRRPLTLGEMIDGFARLGFGTSLAAVDTEAPPAEATASAAAATGSVTTAAALGAPPFAAGSTAAGSTAVVSAAERYLGVPYRWGGTDPTSGLDCSGFVQRVFADLGHRLPRVSADQSRAGTAVPSLAEARPGDLVYWRGTNGRPNHIGIYAGDGQMIHAPRTGDVVRYAPIRSAPPDAIRRVG